MTSELVTNSRYTDDFMPGKLKYFTKENRFAENVWKEHYFSHFRILLEGQHNFWGSIISEGIPKNGTKYGSGIRYTKIGIE